MGLGEKFPDPSGMIIYNSSFASSNYSDAVSGVTLAGINKIVQRFYETRLCRLVWRKAKIPIPAAPKTGFPLRFNTLLGYFGIFTTARWAVAPHFRFKKDLVLYLNSSRAASSGEFKFKVNFYSIGPSPYIFKKGAMNHVIAA
jgi:hypothetical protein